MKAVATLLLALVPPLAGGAAPAAPTPGRLERVPLFGRDYVRLGDWAAACQFDVKWTRKDEEVQAASRWSKLVFEVDSRRAEINGTAVWLSWPVARQHREAFVAYQDLQTALMPLLFPPRSRRGERIKTICLDPGHGGKDPGNQEQRRLEKKFTLLLAQEVQRLLKEANFKVVLTRAEDAYLSLFERTELARKRGADLFLSLHFNAAQGNDVKGIETYCLTPAHASSTNARGEGAETGPRPGNKLDDRNLLLAYHLQRTMVKGVKAEDRGVRRARFFVLKTAEMPAALIEGGFMTDPEEGRKIADPAYSRQLARAIVDGLLAYKKIVERP